MPSALKRKGRTGAKLWVCLVLPERCRSLSHLPESFMAGHQAQTTRYGAPGGFCTWLFRWDSPFLPVSFLRSLSKCTCPEFQDNEDNRSSSLHPLFCTSPSTVAGFLKSPGKHFFSSVYLSITKVQKNWNYNRKIFSEPP